MKTQKVILMVVTLLVLDIQLLHAQRVGKPSREEMHGRFQRALVPTAGIHGAYDFEAEHVGIGIHGQIPVVRRISLAPGGDLYFGNQTTWQMNADLLLGLPVVHPGGGLAIVDGSRVDSESAEVGYNLFLSIQPLMQLKRRPERPVRPFAEVRWTFANEEQIFRLAFGVSIRIK